MYSYVKFKAFSFFYQKIIEIHKKGPGGFITVGQDFELSRELRSPILSVFDTIPAFHCLFLGIGIGTPNKYGILSVFDINTTTTFHFFPFSILIRLLRFTEQVRMSYFRPSFKVDRTQRPPIRTSFGLQLRSDRGQVLLRSADQNDLFVNTGHVHRPDSTVLETILANKICGSRAPSRSNQNHTKHIVSFKPGGTLQRPEIASARERKTQYLNTLAKRREKMVALRYARNTFGFTNARTEHEYKVFSKYATDMASPMQLHLTQLIVALGKVHYPSLCSFANDSSDDDDDLYSDADDSENNCRNPILKDIAIWLLHRHSESGFISLNQWISIVASGDIDTAFDVVTRDRDQVFVVGRKNGGFRPAKGHQYEPKQLLLYTTCLMSPSNTCVKVKVCR